jgi:enoyl-CoA hydratase/carnithine racemase
MTVTTALDGIVGRITLDRPQALNAITIELANALAAAVGKLAAQAGVIVLAGAGGNFSVGGDIDEVDRLRAIGPAALAELFEAFAAACDAIADVPVPVLAAVEGYALAGGFELMQACDVAIVAEEAKIGDHHANFGAIPGGGSTQRLPRLVGRQRALALILSGERLSGTQAVEWGLAYKAAPAADFDAQTGALATRLAGKHRGGQATIKRLVRDGLALPLQDGLALERSAVVEHLTEEAVTWRS